MASREDLDEQYVDYCIKFKEGKALKGSSAILKQFNFGNLQCKCFMVLTGCKNTHMQFGTGNVMV